MTTTPPRPKANANAKASNTPIASISRRAARTLNNQRHNNTPYSPMHPAKRSDARSDDDDNDAVLLFSPKKLLDDDLKSASFLPDVEMNLEDEDGDVYDVQESDLDRNENENDHNNKDKEKVHVEQVTAEEEEYEEEEEFNPYLFMKFLPPRDNSMLLNLPSLPPKSIGAPNYTLVLDLDETLVHCTIDAGACPFPDMTFEVEFNCQTYTVFVKKRPHLMEFLQRIARRFEVVVFTASQSVYANKLLDMLDPKRKLIQHRMFRESCLPVQGNYLKDLTVLGPSRPLHSSILVDNSPHAFAYNLDNGIPIESWFDDLNDKELLKLEIFLEEEIIRRQVQDVREVIRSKFDTRSKIQRASLGGRGGGITAAS